MPNKMMMEAGAARSANGDIKILRKRSALGRASICWNHGVNMKAMKIPKHITTHAEYRNSVRALFDRSHRDIATRPSAPDHN